MRHEPTNAERALWRLLRDRRLNGFKVRRQVPIGRFIADFACLEARLIIEADGGQHAVSVRDAERDAWFAAQGFRVFRFWNDEVLRSPRMVLDTVFLALTDRDFRQDWRHPSPVPSPARGEGDTGVVECSSTSVPGSAVADEAQLPKPPSPLAGEGMGEGSHRSRSTPARSAAGKALPS